VASALLCPVFHMQYCHATHAGMAGPATMQLLALTEASASK